LDRVTVPIPGRSYEVVVGSGVVVAAVGPGACFALNSASFLGILACLLALDTSKMIRPTRARAVKVVGGAAESLHSEIDVAAAHTEQLIASWRPGGEQEDFPKDLARGLQGTVPQIAGSGLTPLEALQSATLGPAEFFRATDSLGTIEPGKVADLVLLDASPLDDIANVGHIAAVCAHGALLGRATLDKLLRDVQAQAAVR